MLSQEEAARKIDANRSAIGHWENGSVPELKDVELACALGMTPNEYLLAQPGLEDAAVQGLAPEDAAAAAEIIETLKMHRKEQPEGRKSPFLIVRDLLRMLSADLALPGVSVPAGTVVRKDSDLNLRAYTPTESGSSSTRGSRTADPLDALKVSEKKAVR